MGSLVGMVVGPVFFPQPPEGQGTPHERMTAAYGGTHWGIVIGMGVGLVVGVAYAVLARRARLRARRAGSPPGPGTHSPDL